QGYIDTLGSGRLLDWRFYPLNDHQYVNTSTKLTDYTATVGAKYDLFKNLNVDFKYRFGRQQSDNRSLFTEQSYFARDLINSYSQLDRTSGEVTYIVPLGSVLDKNNHVVKSQHFRSQLNFRQRWYVH